MKRWISLFLVAAFFVGMAPLLPAKAQVQAHEGTSQAAVKGEPASSGVHEGLTYSISGGEVTITGYTDEIPADVVVPEAIEGLPVTTIGTNAFYECSYFSTIDLSNVTTIEENAFAYSSTLTDISMLAVTDVGTYAFAYCNALGAAAMPAVVNIADGAFYACEALVTITIGDNVESIGEWAFGYTKFYSTSENWQDDALYLSYALLEFRSNSVITEYTIKEGTTLLADMAFFICDALKTVNIPASLKSIGKKAFAGCMLTAINVAEDNATYSSEGGILYSLDKTMLVRYPAASGDVLVPQTVTAVGDYAFYRCMTLTSVDMPSVTAIGNNAFLDASVITVSMSAALTMGDSALSGCSYLKTIEMPAVTVIGDYAFAWCGELTTINIPASLTSIGIAPFSACNMLTTINVAESNEHYSAAEGVLYNKDKSLLISYPTATGDVVVANTVNEIGDSAFYFCTELTAIALPKAVKVGYAAFSECNMLNEVHMPAVTAICDQAFFNCQALEVIDIPVVLTIGKSAFSSCTKLETIDLYAITAIDDNAFEVCAALTGAYVYTDAPSEFGKNVFWYTDPAFSIYYANGTDGWTTPMWNDCPAQEFAPENHSKVTFVDSLTNEVIANRVVANGENAVMPIPPEHENYTFIGWDNDGTSIFADVTITAQYALNTYTVTYVDGCTNETISTETVEHGSDATLPTPPEHVGYTFTGWDSDGTSITADVTITAQYALNTYTVTYVDGCTNETISTETVEHGSDATLPTPPEHEGYTFTGWDSDGTSIVADTTITAQYEEDGVAGDVTGDGRLNTGDAVMILRQCAALITFTDEQKVLADFNKDGRINTGDAVAVLRYCAGL